MGGRGSSAGSTTNRNSMVPTGYTLNEVPARIGSFTTTGETVNGETYESRTYVTRNGEAIKTVTKYADGTRTTTTDAQNYGTEYDRSRAEWERTLAGMARSNIRAGVHVVAIDNKRR